MNLNTLFDKSVLVTSLPPGSVNVRIGNAVEGPGGRWIPCAAAIATGGYVSSVFEIGSGRRQVCSTAKPVRCPDEALFGAIELAGTAAA